MDVDLFDFHLPEELIAQTPLQDRTQSRLLVLQRSTGFVSHHPFTALIHFLQPGDLLVLNNTKVIPARLLGVKRGTGAKAELLLLQNLGDDRWEALVRPGKRLKTGAVIDFGADLSSGSSLLQATIEDAGDDGARVVKFSYNGIFNEILDQLGQMPLPPYIKQQLSEKERYQTVYAKVAGSAAAPTAGLHFTESYLQELIQKGIAIAYVTLHVGLGTFRPVSVSQVEEHHMHKEYYQLSEETAVAIQRTRERGGRVIAVGTTSARTLETAAQHSQAFGSQTIQACSGWTEIFIYPGYTFQAVDMLLTNFHLPKSTLMMLISAFADRETILAAYAEAIEQKYRFFSFGDAMLIY